MTESTGFVKRQHPLTSDKVLAYAFEWIRLEGVASAAPLNMIATTGLPVFATISEALGLTKAETRRMIFNGELTASKFFEIF